MPHESGVVGVYDHVVGNVFVVRARMSSCGKNACVTLERRPSSQPRFPLPPPRPPPTTKTRLAQTCPD